jgi:hypothetical protein
MLGLAENGMKTKKIGYKKKKRRFMMVVEIFLYLCTLENQYLFDKYCDNETHTGLDDTPGDDGADGSGTAEL